LYFRKVMHRGEWLDHIGDVFLDRRFTPCYEAPKIAIMQKVSSFDGLRMSVKMEYTRRNT
jgi:hypothetical protein